MSHVDIWTLVDMPQFALRFDGDHDVLPMLDHWGGRYLVTREGVDTDNPHVHVFIDTDKDIRAIRKYIQRAGVYGNGAYSLKACSSDYAGYLDYICKGESESLDPVVVGYQGFTADQIKQFHANYYVTAESLAEARRKRKKLTSTTVVEEVLEECRNLGLRWTQEEELFRVYIRKYTSGMKGINVFHARQVIATVKCLLDPNGDAEEDLIRRCCN